MSSFQVIFSAAHSGFFASVPLGGGATIANALAEEWNRTRPFDFLLLGPGDKIPLDVTYQRVEIPDRLRNLTSLSEIQYGDFCFRFESAITDYILKRATQGPVCVLSNDISEGPDFERLASHNVRVTTIFHVDVVHYFCRFYLHSLPSERCTRWYEALRMRGMHRLLPGLLRLVFEKQRAAVLHSRKLIVPSYPMKEIILRCYPHTPKERIEVIPWGGMDDNEYDDKDITAEKQRIRDELRLGAGDPILLTLGRISPEKGLERLINALRRLELRNDLRTITHKPDNLLERDLKLSVLICGDAAYMRGERYLQVLRRLASHLRKVKVHFVGHVTGIRKQAMLGLASLYVHPSIHESYGLTIVEAMRAGLPVLTTDHYSARDLVTADSGIIVPLQEGGDRNPSRFEAAIAGLLRDTERLLLMGECARRHAWTMRFGDSAARVADLVRDRAADC